jgi:hypothetical protein
MTDCRHGALSAPTWLSPMVGTQHIDATSTSAHASRDTRPRRSSRKAYSSPGTGRKSHGTEDTTLGHFAQRHDIHVVPLFLYKKIGSDVSEPLFVLVRSQLSVVRCPHYTSRLSRIASVSVISSAYSRSDPMGSPRASRVTRMPFGTRSFFR